MCLQLGEPTTGCVKDVLAAASMKRVGFVVRGSAGEAWLMGANERQLRLELTQTPLSPRLHNQSFTIKVS